MDTNDSLAVAGVAWDLTHLYNDPQDPQVDRDLDAAQARAEAFAARYRGTIDVAGGPAPEWVAAAMAELEAIMELADKPAVFAGLLHAADAGPPAHGALIARTHERGSDIRNLLLFFDLEWLALDEARAEPVIASTACARWRHHLAAMRRYKPHMLSEPEERLLEETANTGRRAFMRLFDEVLAEMRFTVDVDGASQTLNESGVLALLHDPRRDLRQRAARSLTAGLRQQGRVLTYVFNVIVQEHAQSDRRRGYATPVAARHLANEIDAPTVDALIAACEANADLVSDYYQLKRGLLGLDQLADYDRYAPLAADAELVTWPRARDLVLEAYGEFSLEMRDIAARFFAERWIDAEPRDGKRGGAFSSSAVPSAHPYILLSYLGHPRDVMTLAHELGHGVHQYLARPRGHLQADTALTTAETASIFGEMLVFDALRRRPQPPRARLTLICSFIEEAFGTVFRQIALTRFEQRLHEARRGEGELSSERLGDLWMEVNAALYGDSVTLTDDYRWWWAYIPHFIHSPFYCYAYGFGELLVLALYEMYREQGRDFVPRYLELLAAGGSEAPATLLGRLGVDVSQPAFWQRGLGVIRRLVEEAKQLAAA
ncbi:MAG: M3 family oligoendopeptidase [Deltaproteobacteria bacterium]|nr:M3 family oligoendopeptidase [Deltaproteobacteria bacterium]